MHSCISCPFRTNDYDQLKLHIDSKHRNPDEVKCRLCDFKSSVSKLLEDHVKTHVQENLASQLDEKNKIIEDLNTQLQMKNKQIEDLQSQVANQSRNLPEESVNDEIEKLRKTVKDNEKANKKIAETHKKEVQELERAKTNAEKNLNSVIQENTKIKEKEDTMHQILNGLQKLLERYENDSFENDIVNKDDDSSIGEAISKGPIYTCQKCEFTFTNIIHLNKHTRNEHITTSNNCEKCNQQTLYSDEIRKHNYDIHRNEQVRSEIECDECSLIVESEEALHTHQASEHCTEFKCNNCNYKTNYLNDLTEHNKEHTNTKYHCDLCKTYFSSTYKLEAHLTQKHNKGRFPCNMCKHKAITLESLDEHIMQKHGVRVNKKDIDIRNLDDRQPCDPSEPFHSSECCDRRPRSRQQCYFWKQGYCRGGDRCSFLHIKECRFQEQCRNSSCSFFHYQNLPKRLPFLEVKQNPGFQYREEDFPTLE